MKSCLHLVIFAKYFPKILQPRSFRRPSCINNHPGGSCFWPLLTYLKEEVRLREREDHFQLKERNELWNDCEGTWHATSVF